MRILFRTTTACLLLASAFCLTPKSFSAQRLTNSTDKPELIFQQGHSQRSDSLDFSPDNRYLASASSDSTIRIWDAVTGNELRVLKGHTAGVRSVEFSSDGQLLASGGVDGKVKLWDAASGQEIASFDAHKGRVNTVAFSRDNKLLASGGIDNTIKVWDVAAKTEVRTLTGHTGWVNALAFGADNQTLVSGSADKTIKLWNISTSQAMQTAVQPEAITCLSVGSNGEWLASGGADSTVRLWRLAQFSPEPSFNFRFDAGRVVAVSINGNQVFAASSERISKRFDVTSRATVQLSAETDRLEKYEAATFSSDGQRLAISAGTRDLEVRSFNNFNTPTMLTSRANPVRAVAFSNDGRWMATGNQDTSVSLWDVFAGRLVTNFAGNEGSINSVAFSADSQLLATGSQGGIVRLIEVVGARQTRRWQAHDGGVNSLLFSTNGNLVTCSSDQTIKVWDANGNATSTIKQAKGINSISLNADGKLLASGAADGVVKVWDATNWRELRSLPAHNGAVFALSFSNDGKLLASAGADKAIKLWQTTDWQTVRAFSNSGSNSGNDSGSAIYSLTFSPDDKLIAAGNSDGVVKLIEATNGSTRTTLTGASGSVNGLNFNDDGNWLTSAHDDGSLRIWATANGQLAATALTLRESSDWLVVTPEGLFDGSPAAWPQILWRFGQGTFSTAPVEIFFNEFFYPDLLADLLAGKRPQPKEQIAQIDRRQPQVRMLLGDEVSAASKPVTSNQQTVTVKIEVVETGSGAQDVRLFRNGALYKVWRGDALKGRNSTTIETPIPIVAGENRLTAYAFNRNNIKSADANRSVIGAETLRRRGTLRIVTIGVNQYANPNFNLKFAVPDARDFMEELWKRQMALSRFANVQLITIYDEQATKANIVAAIEKLKTAQPEDAVIVYFAGHGLAVVPRFYLIPHDLRYTGKRENLTPAAMSRVLANSISDKELIELFEGVDAGQLVLVIDACNSGQVLESEETRRGPMNSKGLAQLAYEKGISVLTASQSYQAALENKELGHGYLTYALIEDGLRQMAADNHPRDGQVLLREWFDHATAKVPRMQEKQYQVERARILVRKNAPQLKGKVKPEAQRPRLFYRRDTNVTPFLVTQTTAPRK